MSAHAAPSSRMTIGDVLGMLRPEYPDVTISKIRFLEAEGLIEPDRTPAGYRKFSPDDVRRLRYILSAQRDHYLPLRVIRERLAECGDAVPEPPEPDRAEPRRLVAAGAPAPEADVRLTRRQVIDGAGIEPALFDELEAYGLLRRTGRYYDGEAVTIARVVAALTGHGLEVRHLRAAKAAADREVGLIEQVVGPLLRRRAPGAHVRAEETARQLAELTTALHQALVEAALRETLGG